jgi:hypothetical protein
MISIGCCVDIKKDRIGTGSAPFRIRKDSAILERVNLTIPHCIPSLFLFFFLFSV